MAFVRATIAKAVMGGLGEPTVAYCERRWGVDALPGRILRSEVPALATIPGQPGATLTDAQTQARIFLSAVVEKSIFGGMASLRRVPARTPLLTPTALGTAGFVGEGEPAPMIATAYSRDVLSTKRVAGIIATTVEQLRSEDPNSEAIIRRDLISALSAALDTGFLDPSNAGNAATPASITNAIDPVEYDPGETVKVNMARLFRDFSGDLETAVLIGRPETFASLAGADFLDLGVRGGSALGLPALATRSLPFDGDGLDQLALVDAAGVAFTADDVSIEASREASIEMLDSSLQQNAVADVQATNLVNMFQVGGVALMGTIYADWLAVRPGSVSLMTGLPGAEAAS